MFEYILITFRNMWTITVTFSITDWDVKEILTGKEKENGFIITIWIWLNYNSNGFYHIFYKISKKH